MLADLLLKNHNQLRQCGIEDLTCDWQKLESQAKSLGRRAEDKNKELSPEEVGELAMRSKEVLQIEWILHDLPDNSRLDKSIYQ